MLKQKTITIPDGEDKGKVFLLTRMPSFKAEKWAMRALLAMARNGIEVPDDIESMGMAALAYMGVQAIASLRWEDAEPLLDEMRECIKIVPDPKAPTFSRDIIEEDFEEVATLLTLRKEVLRMHVNFTMNAGRLTFPQNGATKPKAKVVQPRKP